MHGVWQSLVTKRKSRGSTADEEHPYELLRTAETKRHVAVDKKTKGKKSKSKHLQQICEIIEGEKFKQFHPFLMIDSGAIWLILEQLSSKSLSVQFWL